MTEAEVPGGRDPQLSSAAEVVLLTLFANDAARWHTYQELRDLVPILQLDAVQLAFALQELSDQGFVEEAPGRKAHRPAPVAREVINRLAEERLSENLRRQRSLREQTEALLIWRLNHG